MRTGGADAGRTAGLPQVWLYLPARLAFELLGAQRGRYWLSFSGAVVHKLFVMTWFANSETFWLALDGQTDSASERGGLGSIPADGIFSAGGSGQRAATTAVVVRSLFFWYAAGCFRR